MFAAWTQLSAGWKAHARPAAEVLRPWIPWLIVHGGSDQTVPVAIGRLLAAYSGSPDTELLVMADGDHTFGIRHPWAGSTPVFDEVLERTTGLLAGAL